MPSIHDNHPAMSERTMKPPVTRRTIYENSFENMRVEVVTNSPWPEPKVVFSTVVPGRGPEDDDQVEGQFAVEPADCLDLYEALGKHLRSIGLLEKA